ncbi:MAG: hypothetical protein IM638_10630 [Bacteroidetes bacterium]|nr:hypothetical protein [Bacteroidota bacterium]
MKTSFTPEENAEQAAYLNNLLDDGIRQELLAIEGVKHVSVGLKITRGIMLWERCFHVYVDKKLPLSLLCKKQYIPAIIGGVKTDVHQIQEVVLATSTPCNISEKLEKVKGGIQISNGYERIPGSYLVGTLGVLGKNNDTCACSTLALTNWHVLFAARSGVTINDESRIFHPTAINNIPPIGSDISGYDPLPDPNNDTNVIGKVLGGKITSKADVGVFQIKRSCSNCCGVPYEEEIYRLSEVSPINWNGVQGTTRAHTGDDVYFVGATSGPSKGYVVSENASIRICLPAELLSDPTVTPGPDNLFKIELTGQLKIRTAGTNACNKMIPMTPQSQWPLGTQWPSGINIPTHYSRFVDHGDSGSLLVNRDNMAVGLIFSSDTPLPNTANPECNSLPVSTTPPGIPPLPADCAPFTLYGYANHFDDVMDVVHNELNINFEIRYKIKPASGSSGEAEVAPSPFEEKLAEWKERAEAHPFTSALYTALNTHKQEVLHLVNHCRPVTVVWQRNKGPAFVNSILNALNESEPSIPVQINGISLASLAEKMYAVLLEQGSHALKTDLEKLGPTILNAIDQRNTVDEIFNALTL